MKTQKMIVLSGLAMLLLAMMINLNVAVAHEEPPYEGGPGDDLQVYFLKKSFDFCNDGLDWFGPADIPGGSVPDGMDVQTSGCVDRWAWPHQVGEIAQDRRDNYAFTGEQIAELVVARDLDGAIAISHAVLQVEDADVAYCNDVSADYLAVSDSPDLETCVVIDDTFPNKAAVCYSGAFWRICTKVNESTPWICGDVHWRNHEVSGILDEYPPQKSESTEAGFDEDYDKLFECLLTVTDDMDGESEIAVTVYDTINDQYGYVTEMFFFNPEVSVDVSTEPIEFEDGYAGDLVYSLNKLYLENAAEGGVDIAVWLGGTDLTSPDMAAKCPYSNILDVEGVGSWEGMDFKCNLDNGLYIEQDWQDVLNKNIKDSCWLVNDGHDGVERCLGLNPLFKWHENVLENGHEADCSFKLRYPVPCIGSFTEGHLIILMRAI